MRSIKNIIIYVLDSIETIFYDITLNEYGSKHSTKRQVMAYVKKMKRKLR